MIHPTAIIDAKARLDSSVKVGPYAVIDGGVELGPDCVVGPHTYLTGSTRIGAGNHFHAGCVIGDEPQDLKYHGGPTRLTIGDHNVFREHVTVNRSTTAEGSTIIGSHNFIMASSHIGHNCVVGDHVIMANSMMLGGHAVVQDRAFISGGCMVHQFTRVGTLAIMQGSSAVSKDVPPFTIVRGVNGICGLNTVGLRRAGYSGEQRRELQRLYHALFRGGINLGESVAAARESFTSSTARLMLDFIASARRGVCADCNHSPGDEEE